MFAFTTRARESQPRKTLRKNISTMISGALKKFPREQVDTDEVTLGGSSEFGSECSTLIDFDIHDTVEATISPTNDESDQDDTALAYENQAWAARPRSLRTPALSSPRVNVPKHRPLVSEATMLDEDDCTWVRPRKIVASKAQRSCTSRKESRKSRNTAPSQQSDLLDPEERSWM